MNTSWKPWAGVSFYKQSEKMGSRVKEGERESVGDDGWSGRPKDDTADENVKVVLTLVMCDRRRDLRSIGSEVGIRFGTVRSILTDILGMSKVSVKWVPRMLTDQKRF